MQSDPASLALHLRHQAGVAGSRSVASDAAPPLGWVADPAREAQRLNGWVEQVEALHQMGGCSPRRGGLAWVCMRLMGAAVAVAWTGRSMRQPCMLCS